MRPPRISGELLRRRASRDRMLDVDTQRCLFHESPVGDDGNDSLQW